jgi:serine/threonine protein kinase
MGLTDTQERLPRLRPYEILDKIADGGSGSVYRARRRCGGGLVAVKILNADMAGNAVLLKRFEQEFNTARSLDHPNLVRALDFGQDGSTIYLAMELVEGECLGERIEREHKLPEADAIRIITQVGQALHHAHGRGMIHRDVKPDNILLRNDGQAKLTDLGLVKNQQQDCKLTRPSAGLGTPHFMAPEQYANAKNVDLRSDIYGLGATMYQAVTGVLPFHESNSLAALMKKVRGDLAPPRKLAPEVSEATDAAIRRAMNPDPAQRPESCLHFLKELIGRMPREGAPTGGPGRRPEPISGDRRFSGRERRVAARNPCSLGSCCIVAASLLPGEDEPQDAWPAVVQNLSARGIGLLLGRRFEPGAILAVELPGTPPRPAQVRHVRAEELGHWFLGCAWAQPLGETDVQSLLN